VSLLISRELLETKAHVATPDGAPSDQSAGPGDRRWIESYLAAPAAGRADDEVDRLLALLHRLGSIDEAMRYGRGIAAAAHDWFAVAFADVPASPHRRFLEQMVDYMLDRES